MLLCATAASLAGAAVTLVAVNGLERASAAFIFGALVAVGELSRMVMPGNREVTPIGSAGAVGYTLLLMVRDEPATHSAAQIVAVTAAGMVIGALPHMAVGRSLRWEATARRLVAVAIVAAVFRPLAGSTMTSIWWAALAAMAGCAFLWCVGDVLIAAMIRTETSGARFKAALADETRARAALSAATAAAGMLIAVATSQIGLFAPLVFSAPILAIHQAFRRYAMKQASTLQTIRAFSRSTEICGYVQNEHSQRVSKLATGIGRALGMTEPQLRDLEYAALMHDIGQLSLRDPLPDGATTLAAPDQQSHIAELSAQMIRQAGLPDRVAQIVQHHHRPYRHRQPTRHSPTSHNPEQPPLASRIITVANAYDDLAGQSPNPHQRAAALKRLALEPTDTYDPTVVQALHELLSR
jgi:putative nucleotidyltransferase with HDIG domain